MSLGTAYPDPLLHGLSVKELVQDLQFQLGKDRLPKLTPWLLTDLSSLWVAGLRLISSPRGFLPLRAA